MVSIGHTTSTASATPATAPSRHATATCTDVKTQMSQYREGFVGTSAVRSHIRSPAVNCCGRVSLPLLSIINCRTSSYAQNLLTGLTHHRCDHLAVALERSRAVS